MGSKNEAESEVFADCDIVYDVDYEAQYDTVPMETAVTNSNVPDIESQEKKYSANNRSTVLGVQTNSTATTNTKPTPNSTPTSLFNYGNILNLVVVLAMFGSLLYGILAAAGTFDDENNTSSQDEFSKDNGGNTNENQILDVCAFQDDFDVRGDGSILLRQYIDISDGSITVEMEYNGIGWIGIAFSESGSMVPNTAIIGLPDTNSVQKYSLTSRSLAGVTPLERSSQTLTETSLIQEDGRTVMKFTKKLVESNEVAINKGENRFNWAYGSSNALAVHEDRGSVTFTFVQCRGEGNNDVNPAPVAAPAVTTAPVVQQTLAPVANPSTPTAKPTSAPTMAPITTPTDAPRIPPVITDTSTPTKSPIAYVAPTTTAPIYGYGAPSSTTTQWTGTWSKRGNRRSCTINTCPTKASSWTNVNPNLGNGCTCTNTGLNSCNWDGNATTVEWYTSVTAIRTNTQNVWQLQASGAELTLGSGGDNASGLPCYDDPLRGGFRVDLSGTGFEFYESSTVTVTGYSPAMRMIADGVLIDEWNLYNADGTFTMPIPSGSTWIEVYCGGWPADCTSTLLVTIA
jgi:hypothetical protein